MPNAEGSTNGSIMTSNGSAITSLALWDFIIEDAPSSFVIF